MARKHAVRNRRKNSIYKFNQGKAFSRKEKGGSVKKTKESVYCRRSSFETQTQTYRKTPMLENPMYIEGRE